MINLMTLDFHTNTSKYRHWRDAKINSYPLHINDLTIEIGNPSAPTDTEIKRLKALGERYNIALYHSDTSLTKEAIHSLGESLGVAKLDHNLRADTDAISALQDSPDKPGREYIPYTNKSLSWHTDGYYNPNHRQIRSWSLHCACPAATGGENQLMDHEIAYILLRDENPEFIAALSQPNAMTIPANIENDIEIRPETTGPVFSVNADGHLHMRFSARKRHIQWAKDETTQAAARHLNGILTSDSPYILKHTLTPGQGVFSNNVLHNRSAFTDSDDMQRLIYRARYYDRFS